MWQDASPMLLAIVLFHLLAFFWSRRLSDHFSFHILQVLLTSLSLSLIAVVEIVFGNVVLLLKWDTRLFHSLDLLSISRIKRLYLKITIILFEGTENMLLHHVRCFLCWLFFWLLESNFIVMCSTEIIIFAHPSLYLSEVKFESVLTLAFPVPQGSHFRSILYLLSIRCQCRFCLRVRRFRKHFESIIWQRAGSLRNGRGPETLRIVNIRRILFIQ
jgi:hypothetical protein